jgi:hypothetical protein
VYKRFYNFPADFRIKINGYNKNVSETFMRGDNRLKSIILFIRDYTSKHMFFTKIAQSQGEYAETILLLLDKYLNRCELYELVLKPRPPGGVNLPRMPTIGLPKVDIGDNVGKAFTGMRSGIERLFSGGGGAAILDESFKQIGFADLVYITQILDLVMENMSPETLMESKEDGTLQPYTSLSAKKKYYILDGVLQEVDSFMKTQQDEMLQDCQDFYEEIGEFVDDLKKRQCVYAHRHFQSTRRTLEHYIHSIMTPHQQHHPLKKFVQDWEIFKNKIVSTIEHIRGLDVDTMQQIEGLYRSIVVNFPILHKKGIIDAQPKAIHAMKQFWKYVYEPIFQNGGKGIDTLTQTFRDSSLYKKMMEAKSALLSFDEAKIKKMKRILKAHKLDGADENDKIFSVFLSYKVKNVEFSITL